MNIVIKCGKCGLTMEGFQVYDEYPTRYYQCPFCKIGVYAGSLMVESKEED